MSAVDVLVVSLGSTGGLRASDAELAGSLRRAGAAVELATAAPQRDVRTLALTDFVWSRAARAIAQDAIARHEPRAIIYSTITAALLWPRPGAIRFDSLAAVNRRGRHGVWQRPLERSRLREAPLLIPLSAAAAAQAPPGSAKSVIVGIPVEPSVSHDRSATRDIAAITYAADPVKKNLGRILKVWRSVRRDDEELVVAGLDGSGELDLIAQPGVRSVGRVEPQAFRALLRRARVFVAAPRFEDYGIAQLEALADGCMLVTTPSPGPYVALPIARELDARLVDDDLEKALRTALDAPADGYARRASDAMAAFRRAAIDRAVAYELLPRLLG